MKKMIKPFKEFMKNVTTFICKSCNNEYPLDEKTNLFEDCKNCERDKKLEKILKKDDK